MPVLQASRSPPTPLSSPDRKSGTESRIDPGSLESCPASTFSRIAASRTLRAMGPDWDVRLGAGRPRPPALGTLPRVGLMPKIPLKLLGFRIDPPPSVPVAKGHIPAATAAPAPPLEPPAVRSVFHGFRHGSPSRFSVVPCSPNSGVLVLPRSTAPLALTRSATTESISGIVSWYARDPMVLRIPLVASRSFREMGMPNSGPFSRPCPIFSSAALAAAKASSPVTVR